MSNEHYISCCRARTRDSEIAGFLLWGLGATFLFARLAKRLTVLEPSEDSTVDGASLRTWF